MCLSNILESADRFERNIAKLKSVAPMYPNVAITTSGNELWANTIVRFEYNGVAYKRHHVESAINREGWPKVTPNQLSEKIRNQCELTINLGIPTQWDDIIGLINNKTK